MVQCISCNEFLYESYPSVGMCSIWKQTVNGFTIKPWCNKYNSKEENKC